MMVRKGRKVPFFSAVFKKYRNGGYNESKNYTCMPGMQTEKLRQNEKQRQAEGKT